MTQAPVLGTIRAAGATDVGKVRTQNEDSMIVDPIRGLYAVLDGMGGANAGDVASQTARDAIRDYVLEHRTKHEPKALLEAAIQHAGQTVWSSAQATRERHGMGTTCVACLVVDPMHAIVAHVGDSRAYLLRSGRLMALTRDHTIVEELVERGLLAAEEAERHPYKNVLSRNLGSKSDTKVDVVEIEIKPGDRLMLCSDGLYGYASAEAIQYLLGSGDEPQHVARDLLDLALRGGGGDNVTAIVLEAPAPAPTTTQVVRTSGAVAWWQRRQRFLQIAEDRGLLRNPICRGLKREEALDLIAQSLCQAVFHDLEKSTGVNVWTFAQNLAGGWFERSGAWQPLRDLVDTLSIASRAVVDEIRTADAKLGFLMDIAVSRALVVAELAMGGLLSERLGQIDAQLIQVHSAMQETIEAGVIDDVDTTDQFAELATVPFLRSERPATLGTDVVDAIGKALTVARARTSPRAGLVKEILGALDAIATDDSGTNTAAVAAARDIYGVRPIDDTGVMPLFDALDQARLIATAAVHQITATDALRASVLRALSSALQLLTGASTSLVLEAVRPFSDRLREAQHATSDLRTGVAEAERRRAGLEGKFASTIDQSQPWDKRGTTEW
ncbi:MAG TPA: Stp1/IreP family PP2C-type Ser/Thr phosphatase [Kofleriaceae bacterium]